VRTWAPSEIIFDPIEYVPLQHEMLDAIAALPGVTSAGFTSALPMEGPPFVNNSPVMVEGRALETGETPPPRRLKLVSPGYFETMGTQIIAGREFAWSDIESGGRVAVISEDFAREFGAEPAAALGARIRTPVDTDAWREVIGVVQSVRDDALYEQAPSLVYWPALMENAFGGPAFGYPAMAYVVRTDRTGTATLINEIRQAIWAVNGDVPIALERTMQDLYAGSLARTSFALVMLAIAGFMALALGIIGIYGVIAYIVTQRTREIGIRIALGAQRQQVRTMFLRHGLVLSAIGLGIGLVAALALTRLMSALLVEVESTDAATYVVAVVVTLIAAALASYIPARRASGIDPIKTLSAE
jgi:predicted permease